VTRRLLDVNVLVALFDPAHANHDAAHGWFGRVGAEAWATCPITENGFVRVVSHPRYPSVTVQPGEAIKRLRSFAQGHPGHEFWADSVSLTDASVFAADLVAGSSQVTDVYLVGLAAKHGGGLATFDRHITSACLRQATVDAIEVIPS